MGSIVKINCLNQSYRTIPLSLAALIFASSIISSIILFPYVGYSSCAFLGLGIAGCLLAKFAKINIRPKIREKKPQEGMILQESKKSSSSLMSKETSLQKELVRAASPMPPFTIDEKAIKIISENLSFIQERQEGGLIRVIGFASDFVFRIEGYPYFFKTNYSQSRFKNKEQAHKLLKDHPHLATYLAIPKAQRFSIETEDIIGVEAFDLFGNEPQRSRYEILFLQRQCFQKASEAQLQVLAEFIILMPYADVNENNISKLKEGDKFAVVDFDEKSLTLGIQDPTRIRGRGLFKRGLLQLVAQTHRSYNESKMKQVMEIIFRAALKHNCAQELLDDYLNWYEKDLYAMAQDVLKELREKRN